MDVTTIYVTHDQEEAMTIADRMAIFRDGEIVQIGTPDEVFNRPDSMDVAGFIGSPPMNLLPAHVEAGAISIAGHKVAGAERYGALPNAVVLGVRPSPNRHADVGLPARQLLWENLGESMLLNVDVEGEIVKVRLPEVRHLQAGETVHLVFDPAHIHLFDPQTRRRIEPAGV
jgi:multiple sugar transport system ATP-binding protein/inositol-phosphate transport system ATP-binding protein